MAVNNKTLPAGAMPQIDPLRLGEIFAKVVEEQAAKQQKFAGLLDISGALTTLLPAPPRHTPIASTADLGTLVRDRRKALQLTQQQFADLAGVGRRFISELEAGKPTLEFGRVLRVCQSVGLDFTVTAR